MAMNKFYAVAIIALTLSAAVVLAGTGIFAMSNEEAKAEYMIQTAVFAMVEASGSITQLREGNITIPAELNSTYEQAANMSQLALQYRNQEQYQLCYEYAIQSQHMFREVINCATQLGANGTSQNMEMAMEALMLRSEIARGYMLMAQIANASGEAAVYGLNISDVEGCVEAARLRLVNATQALNRGDLEEANQTMVQAKVQIQAANQAMDGVSSEADILRAKQYIQNAEGALNRYVERVMAQSGVPEQNRTRAMEMIDQSMIQLQLANGSISEGNITLALQQLEQFRLVAGEACGEMSGGNQQRAEMELGIVSLQLQAEGIGQRIAAMKGYGFNVSAQEQAMEQVQNELRNMECANATEGEAQLEQVRARICATDCEVSGMEQQHRDQERARIMAGIEGMQGRVADLGNRAMQMKGNGSDTGNVQAALDGASYKLSEASRQLQYGNNSGADALLTEAGQMANQAESEMNQMGGGGPGQGQGTALGSQAGFQGFGGN